MRGFCGIHGQPSCVFRSHRTHSQDVQCHPQQHYEAVMGVVVVVVVAPPFSVVFGVFFVFAIVIFNLLVLGLPPQKKNRRIFQNLKCGKIQ
jgi:hypothetical protein